MKTIITRYIIKEITAPLCLALFIFTFVLLMGRILQLMDLMINKGISFLDIAQLILFLLPSFLIYTLPISLLIAVLLALGRLSRDNEIIALKASGVSLYQILPPVISVSLVAAIITAATGLYLVPCGNYAVKNLLFTIAKQKAAIGIKEKVFNDDFAGLVLYTDHIPAHGNYMEGIFVADNRLQKEPITIMAEKGYLISNPDSLIVTLRLQNGSTHGVDIQKKLYKKMDFSWYDINLDLSTSLAGDKGKLQKTSTEMSLWELKDKIRNADVDETDRRDFLIEINKKFAVPLSCLVFGILAIPLGVVKPRTGKSRGFVTGIIIMMTYYLLQIIGEALGETTNLSPVIGTWAPTVSLGIMGIFLFFMAAEEKPLSSLWQGTGSGPRRGQTLERKR